MAATVEPLPRLRHEGFSSAVVEGRPPHWPLPASGDALPLVPSDFDAAAASLGVNVAVVRAVALVESSGRGFDAQSRPKLRFENHYFRRLTDRFYDTTHPDLSNAYNSRAYRQAHTGGAQQQWDLLNQCWALDEADPGIMSCSWGMFQVMGENYRAVGWTSLRQFVTDMFYSEQQHLRAFIGFLRANNLIRYLQEDPPNFTAFAHGYNGPRTTGYDTQMQGYYDQFMGTQRRR